MTTSFPIGPHGFVLTRDMRAAGREAELYAGVKSGRLTPVRRGVFVDATALPPLPSASHDDARRYRLHVEATATQMTNPIFTGWSAVALADLPIIGRWPADVYVLSGGTHGRRRPGLVYTASPSEVDVIEVDGHRSTTLPFTLIQVCRRASLVSALTTVDAALRRPRFGNGSPLTTLDELVVEHRRLGRYRDCRRTEAVLRRATTLSDGPLETVSRLTIEEFGFAEPELQHPIDTPDGTRWVDFFWPDVAIAGEADGQRKYGADAATVVVRVIAEKEREDALRERVRGFVRWGWDDVWRKEPLRAKLMRSGVPLTHRERRLV